MRIEPGQYAQVRSELHRWGKELQQHVPPSQQHLVSEMLDTVAELGTENAATTKCALRELLWKIREPLGEGTPELRRSYEKLRNLSLDSDLPRSRWTHSPKAEEIANFQVVTPGFLRGGQPDQEGLQWLQQNQVNLIIDLRGSDRDNAWNPPTSYPMAVHRIPVEDFQSPTLEQVEEFIELVDRARQEDQKVFLHCKAGIGRTGLMTACWRISQGLSAREALEAETIQSYHGHLRQEQFVRDFEAHWRRKTWTSASPVTAG